MSDPQQTLPKQKPASYGSKVLIRHFETRPTLEGELESLAMLAESCIACSHYAQLLHCMLPAAWQM